MELDRKNSTIVYRALLIEARRILRQAGFSMQDIQDTCILFCILKKMEDFFSPYKDAVSGMVKNKSTQLLEDELEELIFSSFDNLTFFHREGTTLLELRNQIVHYGGVSLLTKYIEGFDKKTYSDLKAFGVLRVIDLLVSSNTVLPIIELFGKFSFDRFISINHVVDSIVSNNFITLKTFNSNNNYEYVNSLVAKFISDLLLDNQKRDNSVVNIYDPNCRSGNLLRRVASFAKRNHSHIIMNGQDVDERLIALNSLVLKANNDRCSSFRSGNLYLEDKFSDWEYDYIVSALPINNSWKIYKDSIIKDSRFPFVPNLSSESELLYIEHIINKLSPVGKAVVICTTGVFFRGGVASGESDIRSWLLSNDYLEKIICLPSGVMPGLAIPVNICVFNKNKDLSNLGKVQIVDVSDCTPYVQGFSVSNRWKTDTDKLSWLDAVEKYGNYKESKYSHIARNEDFIFFQFNVEIKSSHYGYRSRIVPVTMPATEPNMHEFVRKTIIKDPDTVFEIDYMTIKKGCIIRTKLEHKEEKPSIDELNDIVLQNRAKITNLYKTILANELRNNSVSESIIDSRRKCVFKEIGRIRKAPSKYTETIQTDGQLPILSVKYLRGLEDDSLIYPTDEGRYVKVENSDILVIMTGANAGEIIFGKEGYLNGSLGLIQLKDESIKPEFLYLLLKSKEEYIKNLSKGVINNISISDINNIDLIIPSVEEQQEIAYLVFPKVKAIDELLLMLGGAAKKNLENYRKALIEEALMDFQD